MLATNCLATSSSRSDAQEPPNGEIGTRPLPARKSEGMLARVAGGSSGRPVAGQSFSVRRGLVLLRSRQSVCGKTETHEQAPPPAESAVANISTKTQSTLSIATEAAAAATAASVADSNGRESAEATRLTSDDQIGHSTGRPTTCDNEGEAAPVLPNKRSGSFKTSVSKVMTMHNSNYGNNGKVPTAQARHNDTSQRRMESTSCAAPTGEGQSAVDCRQRDHEGAIGFSNRRLIGRRRDVDEAPRGLAYSSPECRCAIFEHEETATRQSAKWRRRLAFVVINALAVAFLMAALQFSQQPVAAQTLQTDPRPTIYSGQISFGLLLSAHSSPGAELSTAASSLDLRQLSQISIAPPILKTGEPLTTELSSSSSSSGSTAPLATVAATTTMVPQATPGVQSQLKPIFVEIKDVNQTLVNLEAASDLMAEASKREEEDDDDDDDEPNASSGQRRRQPRAQHLGRRQIFERPSPHQVRRQQQQQQALELQKQQAIAAAKQQQAASLDSACSQVNPSALYAGMGAIWASHQANLVGDSQLAIGTYVYDSCNDLEIGQRQSVRIVSNLNAFQQTTCESPRGSPISLTIAHGENQLRAIQLLTSFRVPVITTKEPFALEDYHLLTKDQRRFLFSTAPSSRHLAVGALKFTKRVVSRSASSPKLPNQFHKMSSKNGLIVISRNLPARFIAYLTETIPNQVNYEMLQSSQPIDQVRSVEALESILMLNAKQQSGNGGQSSSSGSSSSGSNQESRVSITRTSPAVGLSRVRRNDDQDSGGSGGSSDSDSDSGDQPQQQHRMLSPTILMFITPSEAIDLVTRLRNDLAEVSRYYSLVVTTREDISPALRTIFHRGGSRLCSGKAFYTISPKPDEVHEFSRYFRDTVQMEGESSDHPLICEFAKHQSSSRTNADLDDISTEAVIKAVWSAAAAFKLVHKRECSAALGSPGSGMGGNLYSAGGGSDSGVSSRSLKQGRRQSQTMAGTSGGGGGGSGGPGSSKASTPHAECLVKMNKNMSNLVQRALRKLDVHINSTGLQALDGFRIKFDESNELLTNKFSIKYINKECEITELGQYSGTKDSQLYLDDDVLIKSLESTLPDPWPVTVTPAPAAPASTGSASAAATGSTASGSSDTPSSSTSGSGQDETTGAADSATSGQPESSSNSASDDSAPSQAKNDEEQDSASGADNEKLPSIVIENEAPKRRRSNGKLAKRKIQDGSKLQPVVMSNGRTNNGLTPGLTDFSSHQTTLAPAQSKIVRKLTTNGTSFPVMASQSHQTSANHTTTKSMRKLKPFPAGKGVALEEWLPKQQRDDSPVAVATTRVPQRATVAGGELVESAGGEAGGSPVTSTRPPALMATTLPESGGNTDLDMPAFKPTGATRTTTTRSAQSPSASGGQKSARSSLETAASTTTELTSGSDYVTLPSIVRPSTHYQDRYGVQQGIHNNLEPLNATHRSYSAVDELALEPREPRLGYLRDLSSSPSPLLASTGASRSPAGELENNLRPTPASRASEQRSQSRSRLKSHLKWIYGSWFTLVILGANICGALLTLYVLTFLLVKNCDGSLDRENQGIRSMHLLSIIVVFFGSTLFIVYPTPSLCLLRSSWHNFALVLMFGSLLLQTMQTRCVSSIGLGGRPNRLNQFLTLLFMVGVQVSFELQRWKYESANYVNFVNQYFSSQENGDKKLLIFSNSFAGQFNPLNSFNDQVTPVSIQVSEKYQNLLHDYCSQPLEDFLQSQFYLWLIMGLLIVFSITNRRLMELAGGANARSGAGRSQTKGGLLAQARAKRKKKFHTNKATTPAFNLTSGKLLASQHETNELMVGPNLSPTTQTFGGSGPFSVGSKVAQRHSGTGDVFLVTLISVPTYFISIILHVHGQNLLMANHHDLVASVTMVLVAFTVLIGIFLPVLRNYHRFGELVSGPTSPTSSASTEHQNHLGGNSSAGLSHPILGATTLATARKKPTQYRPNGSAQNSPSSGAFAMFPEFASTGLRRPSSIGGDSLGRRPFAETKESRRNMGLSLANLPPEPDSLRSLCVHNHRLSQGHHHHHHHQHNHHQQNRTSTCSEQQTPTDGGGSGQSGGTMANMKLNLSGVDEESATLASDHQNQHNHHQYHHHHHHPNEATKGQQHGHKAHQNHQNVHHHRKSQPNASSRRSSMSSTGEKRLIMLDVDPCCPRHGVPNSSSPMS